MRWILTTVLAMRVLTACPSLAGEQPPVFELKWGSLGSAPGQFAKVSPFHVAIDAQGMVYVADNGNHRVQKFDSSGMFLTEWGSFGVGEGQFSSPFSIAVDGDGEVFVGEATGRIQVFTSAGAYLRWWTVAAGGDTPNALAVGSDGSVYMSSEGTSRVLKFSNEGQLQGFWGSVGTDDGEFYDPRGIAVDTRDNVYVSDLDGRVQKFTSDGDFVARWDVVFGLGTIAADADDRIYVVDSQGASGAAVHKFTSDGVFLTEWGAFGSDDGEFSVPWGIAAGPSREIYIADYGLHRIQKFSHVTSVEAESWARIKGRYQKTW